MCCWKVYTIANYKEKIERATKNLDKKMHNNITNFIQLVSPQPGDQFLQTKLYWKAPNKGYLHICGMYKINNKQPRYQAISNYKSFVG